MISQIFGTLMPYSFRYWLSLGRLSLDVCSESVRRHNGTGTCSGPYLWLAEPGRPSRGVLTQTNYPFFRGFLKFAQAPAPGQA
jgi:hypothetical protein